MFSNSHARRARARRPLVGALTLAALVAGSTLIAPPVDAGGSPGRILAGACEEGGSALYEIPLEGGAATDVGEILAPAMESDPCVLGLAYDTAAGQLYAAEENGELLAVPLTAGESTVVGDTDIDDFCGLEYDPVGGQLWSNDYNTGDFYTIDPATGAADLVGPTGQTGLCGFAYDPNTDTLFAIGYSGDSELYTIDTETGAATLVGLTGIEDACGLAFDSDQGRLLVVEDNENAPIYELDPETGAATELGEDTGISGICGLAYIPAQAPATTTTTAPATTTTAAAAAAVTPRFTG